MNKRTYAKNHILNIRRKKFGINDEGQIIAPNALSDDLHAALSNLAEGLYSKELHFIFELIQNAEDNNYPEAVRPELLFEVLDDDPTSTPNSEGCLCVFNNEEGFQKDNVEKICAVGQSTKKNQEGYIGEKGIGFKSVFLVTEEPHIFSNGYGFRFQEEDPSIRLGYIVPYWVDKTPRIVTKTKKETSILLPLKKGKKSELARELKNFAPETILFLKKLEGLTIHTGCNGETLKILRDEGNKPFVQLLAGNSDPAKYFVINKRFKCPSNLKEEKRKNIRDRTVTVAFPMSDVKLLTGKIFAYLPTEIISGLPFLVNADFILASGRETIIVNRRWNLWLRDCITSTFVEAFCTMLKYPDRKMDVYRFIPIKEDLKQEPEFFEPIAKNICLELGSLASVLTISPNLFKKPDKTRLAQKDLRELLNQRDSPKYMRDIYLVHPDLEKYRERLKAIGVKELAVEEFLNVLDDLSWVGKRSTDWFVKLYKYFANKNTESKLLENIALIPTECKRLVSPKDSPIYHSLEEKTELLKLSTQIPKIATDMLFLKRTLCKKLKNDQDVWNWIYEALNVREFSPSEYIVHSLIPSLKKNIENLSQKELINATRFIRDQTKGLDDKDIEIVQEGLPILLDDGSIVLREHIKNKKLVAPRALDPYLGWHLVFTDEEDIEHLAILSDDYIKKSGSKAPRAWGDFFDKIDITDTPDPKSRIVKRYNNLTRIEEEIFTKWNEDYTDYERVENWVLPKWLNDLKIVKHSNRATKQKSLALLAWLKRFKLEHFQRFLETYYCWFYYSSHKRKSGISDLKDCLLEAPWFPSTKGLKRPGEVFIKTPEIYEMFGNKLAYATEDPSDDVCSFLGIHQHATTESILSYLDNLSKNEEKGNLKVIAKMYRYLRDYGDNISEFFKESPLIYCPNSNPCWQTSKDVIWQDLSTVFGDLFAYLSPVYDGMDLQGFFVKKLEVAISADTKQFADAWIRFSELEDPDPKEVEAALELIYPKILTEIKSSSDWPDWWDDFSGKVKLWTQNDTFKPPNNVYVPDNAELKRHFEDSIFFVWRPEKRSFSDFMQLYEAFGTPVLSESIKITLEEVDTSEEIETLSFLTENTKRLIFYWIWNEFAERFESFLESGMFQRLFNTVERKCDEICLKYDLPRERGINTVVDKNHLAYWDDSRQFLFLCNNVEKEDLRQAIAESLARSFWGGRNLKDYEPKVYELLFASEKRANNIINRRNWSLPAEHKSWFNEHIKVHEQKTSVDQTTTESKKLEELSVNAKPDQKSFDEMQKRFDDVESVSGETKEMETIIESSKTATEEVTHTELEGDQISKDQVLEQSPKLAVIGKSEWQPECKPEQAEIQIDQLEAPNIKEYSTFNTRSITNKTRADLFNEEDMEQDILSAEDKKAIGKWGEEYTLKCLEKKYSDNYPKGLLEKTEDGFTVSINRQIVLEVYWLNKKDDRGIGYDIEVIEKNNKEYIEVKSTKTDAKDWFDLSRKQWEFAQEMESKFHIFRIYNAGTKQAKYVDIQNPIKLWQKGDIIAYPIRIKI